MKLKVLTFLTVLFFGINCFSTEIEQCKEFAERSKKICGTIDMAVLNTPSVSPGSSVQAINAIQQKNVAMYGALAQSLELCQERLKRCRAFCKQALNSLPQEIEEDSAKAKKLQKIGTAKQNNRLAEEAQIIFSSVNKKRLELIYVKNHNKECDELHEEYLANLQTLENLRVANRELEKVENSMKQSR